MATYQIPEIEQALKIGAFRLVVELEDMCRRLEQFKVEMEQAGEPKPDN